MNPVVRRFGYSILGNRFRVGLRLKKIVARDALTILNLHRVSPLDGRAYKPLAPEQFESLLGFVLKNFQVTTFGELARGERSQKPLLILSFDDGYKDFVEFAAPLMKKFGVRANLNIIPECVDSGLPPFEVCLQDYIGKASDQELRQLRIPGLNRSLDDLNRPLAAEAVSRFIRNLPAHQRSEIKSEVMKSLGHLAREMFSPMMNLSDVRAAQTEHEIGAHSFGHADMSLESNDFFENDLKRCREWFEKNLGQAPEIYAFPYGACRDNQIEMARQNGFRHVLLLGEAFSRRDGFMHSRFGFASESMGEMRFRSAGGFRKIG